MHDSQLSRRALIAAMGAYGIGAVGATALFPAAAAPAAQGDAILRAIPGSGETIPAIGMGTWVTFNVGEDTELRNARSEVLQTFFDRGGRVIDSSPMYGSSEEVVGYCLKRVENGPRAFAATKVWSLLQTLGKGQIEDSHELWGREKFDLMQVHNLLNWESHLETLRKEKADGRLRYIGVTTSHGRRHDELEDIMRKVPLDFVQFTYNVVDREAEARLLPLAADRGLAVLINRPFRRKELFERYEEHPLPEWAADFDCANWAQFFLKFIISHPAVTCTIPATTRIDHMNENMGALYGRLPDRAMRKRMVSYIETL